MGHDEHGADVLDLFQAVLDEQLRFGIDVGGGLVHHQDGGIVGQRPGKAQELALARRQRGAPLRHRLVVASGQAIDERGCVGRLGSPAHLFLAHLLVQQPDVAADVAGEDEHVLLPLADGAPQHRRGDLTNIHPVVQDLSLLDVVVADN